MAKTCEKCGKEIPANAKVCSHCGYKSETISEYNQPNNKSNDTYIGFAVSFVAIISVVILFSYRAWLGGLLYLIAGILAIALLRQNYENNETKTVEEFIKKCFTGKNIINKLLIIISFLMPVIEIVATYRWIVYDTIKEVSSMY